MPPSRLYYKNNGKWEALPLWSQFFFDLGYALASLEDSKNRVVVGVALPTQAYAAAFSAIGVVAHRLSLLPNSSDALKRFHQLTSVTIGTSIIYRKFDRVIRGTFEGVEVDKGCSRIRLRSGNQWYVIPPSLALQLEIPEKEFSSPPKQSYRRTSSKVSPFLLQFLSQEAAKVVSLQSQFDCVIIGSLGRLRREVNETQLAVQNTSGKLVSGSFQDILRARKFSTNEAYRSDVYHIHSKESIEDSPEVPLVTVFDGAASFLKARNAWQCSHSIVLFDLTEPEFEAGRQAFNMNFIKNHLDETTINWQLNIPTGLQISIHQEAKK